ncbi:energy transducer TonB [Acidicapsa acidisoli]|uniref:energy transducer TonB n=1 Tax=Acidicapsa acidisoli TaxID=1615681 RepID=UPI0021DF7269|nr:energy transducer TonB [Acidicapsa acidisoli]
MQFPNIGRTLSVSGFAFCTSVLLSGTLFSVIPSADAQATARDALNKGLAVTGLTAEDAPAWHIKANYSLYDRGNLTESGTLEEWATGPYTWRRTYSEKKQVNNEWSVTRAKQFQTKDSKLNLAQLDERVATTLTAPLFQAANYKPDMELDGRAGTFAGQTLNCVAAANPTAAAGIIDPNVLFPRLCFDVKDATLRYVNTPTTLISYTEFKTLGNRQVATKVNVNYGGKVAADLAITLLEPLTTGDQGQIAPDGKAAARPYMHLAGDVPLVPVKITECAYPMAASVKQEHGIVYIPVVIRKDGGVKPNGGAQGPPELAEAAGDCVGNWKFEPFKLDGEAIDVADTLIYNYDGKPFKGVIGIASEPPPSAAK